MSFKLANYVIHILHEYLNFKKVFFIFCCRHHDLFVWYSFYRVHSACNPSLKWIPNSKYNKTFFMSPGLHRYVTNMEEAIHTKAFLLLLLFFPQPLAHTFPCSTQTQTFSQAPQYPKSFMTM